MNMNPTLCQELETAKILQELSKRSVVQNAARSEHPRTASLENVPKRQMSSLKRKHWSTTGDESWSQASGIQTNSNMNPSMSVGRPVSPGTDSDSLGETSSSPGLSISDATFKPLSAPPTLRRVSFKHTHRLETSVAMVHPSPSRGHLNPAVHTTIWNLPPMVNNNMATSANNTSSVHANTLNYKMMLQLMSNPMLNTNSLVPICLPAGNGRMLQGPTEIASGVAMLPKLGIASHPSLTPEATESTAAKVTKKKRKVCRMDDCDEEAARRTPYCTKHCGQRKCEFEGCNKCAQGRTRFCIGHGGGRRCQYEGCKKGARDKHFCASHGGGRRCNIEFCTKLAVGRGRTCTAHGGGRRCQNESCSKSAQSSSDYCVRHGGGRKCRAPKCSKVARGKLGLCMSHATQQDIKVH